jgi:hypothetical protein
LLALSRGPVGDSSRSLNVVIGKKYRRLDQTKVGHALRAAISAINSGDERTIYDVIGAFDADAAISEDEQHGQHSPGQSRKRKLCEQQNDSVGTNSNDTWLADAFALDVPLPDLAPSNDMLPGTSSESNDTVEMLNDLYDSDMALDGDDVLNLEFDPLFDDVDENVDMVFDQQYSEQYAHLFEELLDDVVDEQNEVSFSIYGWAMADVAPCSG